MVDLRDDLTEAQIILRSRVNIIMTRVAVVLILVNSAMSMLQFFDETHPLQVPVLIARYFPTPYDVIGLILICTTIHRILVVLLGVSTPSTLRNRSYLVFGLVCFLCSGLSCFISGFWFRNVPSDGVDNSSAVGGSSLFILISVLLFICGAVCLARVAYRWWMYKNASIVRYY